MNKYDTISNISYQRDGMDGQIQFLISISYFFNSGVGIVNHHNNRYSGGEREKMAKMKLN